MEQDRKEIHAWLDRWLKCAADGDREGLERLIADDAVFLVPHAGVMDKMTCAAAATAQDPNVETHLDCRAEEVEVRGDWAWLRTRIDLVLVNKETGARSRMAGHSLSILERRDGRWVVVRDANTVVPVPEG